MLKQVFAVTCLLLVFQQAVGKAALNNADLDMLIRLVQAELHTELQEGRQMVEKPDLVEYMKEHCGVEMETLEKAQYNDGVTSAEVLAAYENSNIDQWKGDLENRVATLTGSDMTEAYHDVVCTMAFLQELGVRQEETGETEICEGEDVDVTDRGAIFGCLGRNAEHLEAVHKDLNGATDFDDAVGDLVRIIFTLHRIQEGLNDLGQINQERRHYIARLLGLQIEEAKQQRVASDEASLLKYIEDNCDPGNIMSELKDNTPVTVGIIKEGVRKAKIGEWLEKVEAAVADPSSTDSDWDEEILFDVICSFGPLLAVSNHLVAGGDNEICEGKEVDKNDAGAVTECLAQNLSDLDDLDAILDGMDENTSEEDISVVVVNVITALGRTQQSLWALYGDIGGEKKGKY